MALRSRLLLLSFVLIAAAPAAGQDPGLEPNYGAFELGAGDEPWQQLVALEAGGGGVNAEAIGPACRGFIWDAPDIRVDYEPGGYQLLIAVTAGADTTLVVRGPAGSWHCDDDGGESGSNPLVRFESPQGGRYDIWVGLKARDGAEPADIDISEVDAR